MPAIARCYDFLATINGFITSPTLFTTSKRRHSLKNNLQFDLTFSMFNQVQQSFSYNANANDENAITRMFSFVSLYLIVTIHSNPNIEFTCKIKMKNEMSFWWKYVIGYLTFAVKLRDVSSKHWKEVLTQHVFGM